MVSSCFEEQRHTKVRPLHIKQTPLQTHSSPSGSSENRQQKQKAFSLQFIVI
jgi:hypothetical protein